MGTRSATKAILAVSGLCGATTVTSGPSAGVVVAQALSPPLLELAESCGGTFCTTGGTQAVGRAGCESAAESAVERTGRRRSGRVGEVSCLSWCEAGSKVIRGVVAGGSLEPGGLATGASGMVLGGVLSGATTRTGCDISLGALWSAAGCCGATVSIAPTGVASAGFVCGTTCAVSEGTMLP
jgi:hypothetical protein